MVEANHVRESFDEVHVYTDLHIGGVSLYLCLLYHFDEFS